MTRKGRLVFVLQYFKGGHLITDVIGTVNKMHVLKARKKAAKILSDPTIRRVLIPDMYKWRPPPEPEKPEGNSPPVPKVAKRRLTPRIGKSESASIHDNLRPALAKEVDVANVAPKPLRKLVVFDELKERFNIPYGRTHLARLEKIGKFPKRVAIGEGRIGWVESEIEAHIEAMLAKRSGN